MTVAEKISIWKGPNPRGDPKGTKKKGRLGAVMGASLISPYRPRLEALSIAKQLVEILKRASVSATLSIMDEPCKTPWRPLESPSV